MQTLSYSKLYLCLGILKASGSSVTRCIVLCVVIPPLPTLSCRADLFESSSLSHPGWRMAREDWLAVSLVILIWVHLVHRTCHSSAEISAHHPGARIRPCDVLSSRPRKRGRLLSPESCWLRAVPIIWFSVWGQLPFPVTPRMLSLPPGRLDSTFIHWCAAASPACIA